MDNVHRIEIIVDSPHAATVVQLLADQGLQGYSLIRGVSGSGERGSRHGDDITGVATNNYILTTCAPDQLEAVTEALRPLLARIGGMCLVSEARWLRH